MKYEFTRKEIIERKRNADSNVGNSDSAYNPNGTSIPNDLPYMTGAQFCSLLKDNDLIFSNLTCSDFFIDCLTN